MIPIKGLLYTICKIILVFATLFPLQNGGPLLYRSRAATFYFLLLLVSAFTCGSVLGQSLQREIPAKADVMARQTMAPSGRVVVKFTEASQMTVRESGLTGPEKMAIDRFLNLVGQKSSGLTVERRFEQSFEFLAQQRQAGMTKARRSLPDLNAYGVLDFSHQNLSRAELLNVLKPILADPAVEIAFLEPKAVPAALGFDAFTGIYTQPEHDTIAPLVFDKDTRDTPDFTSYQGYLLAPPGGVNAMAAEAVAGGRGGNMKMIDVELGWNMTHEDLPAPFFTHGNITSNLDNRNHGTAVLGEIRGSDNGFGVRGITPDAQVGASSAYFSSVSNALMTAWQALDEGDVILIELHAPGPNADGTGQFGYVPMEYWQDNFDAIMTIVAAGGVVVEAAGNGTQNLDDSVYGSLFDRNYRDSGAIMCGATTIGGTPYSWSNNGSRVDLNGWGGNVGTCGYGDLQNTDEDVFYTAYFSGTSSASPIVTGAVMALQGMAKANYNFVLDALTIRTLMAETGTPQNPGGIVGPRPDIMAAYQDLEWGLGEISGVISDATSGEPIDGVHVQVSGREQSMTTGPDGAYHFVTNVGQVDLIFNQFFYYETTDSREVVFDLPAELNVTMERLPTVDIKAVIRTESGAPLTTGRATALGTPLIAEAVPGSDSFLLAGAPIGVPLDLIFDGEPHHGVDHISLVPAASPTGFNFLYPELASAEHDFELWWYNYTSQGGNWVWGIPTSGPTAFSGEKCWAVGLDGVYPDGVTDFLNSESFNLYGNEEVRVSFHYWCDLEEGADGVNFQIQSYNNTWIDLEPLGGYSHDNIQALGNKPGWSGSSGGWKGAVFDITEYTELAVTFRLKFASDSSTGGAGFFIDDITFDTGNSLSPVNPDEVVPTPRAVALSAHPNPFNPQTTLNWEITRPGPMTIRVFDTRGRLIRQLRNEFSQETQGAVTWDGRNDRGEGSASGTYLVQVKDASGQASTRRVTLVK